MAFGFGIIGCGMIAVKTSLKKEELDTETLKKIMSIIRQNIPVGFNKHKEPCSISEMPGLKYDMKIVNEQYGNARKSLGTLGGGNHFIEIQKGDDGFVWIMIHSGSRNLGKKVCDHYNKLAQDLNEKWYSEVQNDLAFLPLDSEEGKDYIEEMTYCLEFAQKNREKMMAEAMNAFIEYFDLIQFDEPINMNHNDARLENHFGKNVWIHRKGATRAYTGEKGIIPGSQGTCSYIVEGLGNPESFKSCSHGAGRKMGRNVARQTLDLKKEVEELDKKGIIHAIRNEKDLDEAPGSYKDIKEVMKNQEDLVKILVKLEPLGVVKG
ncbi:RtcB family protein [bacterium]|nr:RtcB family protein [bacterium]